MSDFRPVDVPILHAETQSSVAEIGPTIYRSAIEAGTQRCKPDLPSIEDQVAALTRHEAARLRLSELFYVSADMAALARSASESMPSFALVPEDLPAQAGFILFEDRIDSYIESDKGRTGELRVVAACWGPCWGAESPAIWITFYTDSWALADSLGQAEAAAARSVGWRLAIHDEVLTGVSGQEPKLVDHEGETIEASSRTSHSTASWFATLKTCWLLMGQTISSVSDAHFDRATRRRMARLDLTPPRVRVITLRRVAGDGTSDETDREFRHRWIVRGHWRQQWLPSRGVHRPTWIAPHIKGPEGAPLLGGEKVYALKR